MLKEIEIANKCLNSKCSKERDLYHKAYSKMIVDIVHKLAKGKKATKGKKQQKAKNLRKVGKNKTQL